MCLKWSIPSSDHKWTVQKYCEMSKRGKDLCIEEASKERSKGKDFELDSRVEATRKR